MLDTEKKLAKMITGLEVMRLTRPCPSVPKQFPMEPQDPGFPLCPTQYAYHPPELSATIHPNITSVETRAAISSAVFLWLAPRES